MTLPNFIVLGAPKCGTDALYKHLSEHPEIYMSPVKEPMFMAIEGQIEPPYRGPRDREQLLLECWVPTLERYQALFDGVCGEKAIGEASTWYLYAPEAHVRIKRYVPDARLIAVLRNPADRAYSGYTMLVRDGREPEPRFRDALRAETARVAAGWEPAWHYVRNGFYYRQLKRYYDTFDRAQLHVVLHDDFVNAPTAVMRDIFGFLQVDEAVSVDVSRRANVSLVPRNFRYHAFVAGQHPLKTAAKSLLPARFRQDLKTRFVERNLVKPEPLEAELRAELIEVFRDDILRLQDLLQRDLSHWLIGDAAAPGHAASPRLAAAPRAR